MIFARVSIDGQRPGIWPTYFLWSDTLDVAE
jgi:hypothetical protein